MVFKIHFIGIGGIGVSALARYYLENGNDVSGSDLASSEITEELEKLGIKINYDLQKAPNPRLHPAESGKQGEQGKCQKLDFVVYSPAVQKDNPELTMYREMGIKCQSYPEALGELTKKYFTIAVSGAHGKSTTTSMLALVLIKAGLDPTVIVGTKLKEFSPSTSLGAGSNFRMGKSPVKNPSDFDGARRYLLIEACEYEDAFLNYWPKIITLTNIDKEHLDYFKNFKNILTSFKKYISHLPEDGVLVYNADDKNIEKITKPRLHFRLRAEKQSGQAKKYSLKQKEAKEIKKILKVPGTHNVYNALAVLETARVLGIDDKITYKALSEFHGTWRRFEETDLKIKNSRLQQLCCKHCGQVKLKIISDYGHHPNEVRATLQATREKYPDKKIWCVFQPHQYQRTFYLFKDFTEVFKKAKIDKIILTDIYSVAGRESDEIKNKVNSEKLVKAIKKSSVIYKKENELKSYLLENLKDGDVLLIMGAGNIYKLIDEIKKPLFASGSERLFA